MRGFWADEKADGGAWDKKKWFWRKVFEFYKKKENAFVSQASHVISLTDAGKTEITKWPFYNTNIPISVIPCCADQNHFKITNILKKKEARKNLGIDDAAIVLSYLGLWVHGILLMRCCNFLKSCRYNITMLSF